MSEALARAPGAGPASQTIEAFISANLRLEPVPLLPGIRLYGAHPGSGLGRLPGVRDAPPYWAWRWAGGLALARYLLDRPDRVAGLRVLDLGAGCGVVGIAALKAGAASLLAAETDPNGCAALALNARANGVDLAITGDDLLDGPPPQDIDLVAVGDLFYDVQVARRTAAFLDRCAAAGLSVVVGDPGRRPLPRERLDLVARYAVPDFGDRLDHAGEGLVFTWRAAG